MFQIDREKYEQKNIYGWINRQTNGLKGMERKIDRYVDKFRDRYIYLLMDRQKK